MVALTRRTVVLAKIESTYNTDPTPSASTDAILCGDVDIQPSTLQFEKNPFSTGHAKVAPALGRTMASVSFGVELGGQGATKPNVDPLLLACGMQLANTTWESAAAWVYTLLSDADGPSVTLYIYRDGVRHILTGCRGTFDIGAVAGGYAVIRFNFQGFLAAPTSTALPSATLPSTLPPIIQLASFTYQSETPCSDNFAVSLGNMIVERSTAAATHLFRIADRNVKMNFEIEAPNDVASANAFSWVRNGTAGVFKVNLGNKAANDGRAFQVYCPNLILDTVGYTDRSGVLTYKCGGVPRKSSTSNDELTLAFWK